MKRFGVSAMSLILVIWLSAAPAGAQDKFTMGYGAGT